jgi:uncharacterized membrane protein YsdA (DUF1294 family)
MPSKNKGRRRLFSFLLAGIFFLLLAALVALAVAPVWLAAFYVVASGWLFLLYGVDKYAARKNWRRIRESTLHLFGLAGGWPGALVAQQLFRHKTAKQPFRRVFWALVGLNCGMLALFLSWDDVVPLVSDIVVGVGG